MDAMTRSGEIVVAGVGGAGVNAILRLADHSIDHVRQVAVDTSVQALARVPGVCRVALTRGTDGRGTGGDVELGRQAARAAEDEILRALDGADFVLVVGGLAGGTGGGAAPEVARLAREAGATAIGFGIGPFAFEGVRAREASRLALEKLADACDACFPMDTARAVAVVGDRLPLDAGLRVADDVLRQALEGLHGLIHARGWIDVGPLGVRAALEACGEGCMSVGMGRGPEPALAAMRAALASPLMDMSRLGRARSALVHLAGDREMAIADVSAAMDLLRCEMAPDCRMVVGCAPAPLLVDAARVTVMALAARPAASAASGPAPRRTSQRPAHHAAEHPAQRPAYHPFAAFESAGRRAGARPDAIAAAAPTARPVGADSDPIAAVASAHRQPSAAAEFSRRVRERVPTLDSLRQAEADRPTEPVRQAV